MNRKYIIILPFLIFLMSCERDARRIVEHQDEIFALSKHQDISYHEARHQYSLETYSPDSLKKNMYFFSKEKKDGKTSFSLMNDSIQFNPDVIAGIDRNSDDYQEKICSYYQSVAKRLEFYRMNSLSNTNYKDKPYIKLTILITNGPILTYGEDEEMAKDTTMIKYYKKIGDGWYLCRQWRNTFMDWFSSGN